MRESGQHFAIATAALAAFSVCGQASSPTLTTLYQFTGNLGGPDGSYPLAPLTLGPGGMIYGTTRLGGVVNSTCPQGCGTVFSLTPSASSGLPWNETVLHSFTAGSDGYWPTGALILDQSGVLYGTTAVGGVSGLGTVFSLEPPVLSGAPWVEQILYNFVGPVGPGGDGAGLFGKLVMADSGALYGTTQSGGTYGLGTVFSLVPPTARGNSWSESVLWSFGGEGDGSNPLSGLVGSAGKLYGTTALGGASNYGTVFSLVPPTAPGGAWTEAVLHSFAGGNDGANPEYGSLVVGARGGLFGTTLNGGQYAKGTVFSLAPPTAPGGAWTENVIFSFLYRSGDLPDGGLALDKAGNLYGATSFGGDGDQSLGTVFQLAPPVSPQSEWKFNELYSFTARTGIAPMTGVTLDPARKVIYGTTSGYYYINQNGGTVFSLTF